MCVFCVLLSSCLSFCSISFNFGFYSIQLASVKSIDCTMVLYPTKIESFAGFSASTQSKMICAISMNQFADKHMQILQCISHRKYEHRDDMKVMQLSCFLKSFGFCMSFVCILDPNAIDSVAQFYDYRILFKCPNAILCKHMECEMISSPSHSLGLSFRVCIIKFTPYFVHIGWDISGLKGQFYRTSFIEFTNESDWFDNIVVGYFVFICFTSFWMCENCLPSSHSSWSNSKETCNHTCNFRIAQTPTPTIRNIRCLVKSELSSLCNSNEKQMHSETRHYFWIHLVDITRLGLYVARQHSLY